ncbi:MAG: cobalt-zinc-cadmium resistance protein CzcA, partial [Chitinophagaceae bacterium]|nr:cobalt-zinc-cadmium resistance protein CzcA [Chitinophagaceae bacterium]
KNIIIASVLALFIVAVFVLTRLGGEFIPSLEEGDFAVETRVLTGSNLNTSMNAVSQGARILLEKFPEVEKVVGKTGSSEIPTDPMPIDASDMMVILKDKNKWTSAKTFPELTEKMSKELEAVPGVTFGFQYPVQMRFNELMTGARQDVVCKIFGEDLDTLALYAKKLGDISGTVKGARDLYVESVTGMPQIVILYNRAAIAQYGLNIRDINRVVNAAFAGESSGKVYEGEKRFDLVVRLSAGQRKDLKDVQNLLIPASQGTQIPLYQVATIQVKEGPNQIQREDAQRRIIVGFNVRGRDVQTMVKELQQKVEAQIKLPPGYHITYGGAFENLEAAKDRLSIAVPVSLLLIFLILYFAFNSVRQGLLIYSAIPLSAIGGILALAIRGMPFSISAGIGFIALFGVAVLNGIVLIAEFNRLKKEGLQDAREIVLQGTQSRLRPVLMTALVASLGFLPMALSNGAGAEVQRPLATVVIGGLLIATFLTLFVLPVLYILFTKKDAMKIKPHAGIATLLLLSFSFLTTICDGQQPISLQGAVDTALKNNLSLRNEKLMAEYLEKLKGSGTDIPQTMITGDVGQINSYYTDTKFSISQNIKFPNVYTRQKKLLVEEWKSGVLNVSVKENELKKRVTQVFYELLYLKEKEKLLKYTDSIFSGFRKNAGLRFSKGESNILEKTTAETQQGQVNQQLIQVQQDYSILLIQLKWLLNTNADFFPAEGNFKMEPPVPEDSVVIRQHPYIQYLQQQLQISYTKYRLEKSKLSPDLFIVYNNMSIKGTGADNKTYDASTRFHSAQAGIGVPVFQGSQKSRIDASKINQSLSENKYIDGVKTFQSQYEQAIQLYKKRLQTVNYYESNALKNVNTIITTANKQFLGGDINYLDWVLLTNQAVSIQGEYIDAVRSLNQSIIEINSITNQ